jgi:hypothetical protein
MPAPGTISLAKLEIVRIVARAASTFRQQTFGRSLVAERRATRTPRIAASRPGCTVRSDRGYESVPISGPRRCKRPTGTPSQRHWRTESRTPMKPSRPGSVCDVRPSRSGDGPRDFSSWRTGSARGGENAREGWDEAKQTRHNRVAECA